MDLITNGIWVLTLFGFVEPYHAALLVLALFAGGVIIPLAGLVAERARAEQISGGRWWAVGVALFSPLALPLFIALRGFPRGRSAAERLQCLRARREYLIGATIALMALFSLLVVVGAVAIGVSSMGNPPAEVPWRPAYPRPARETLQFEAKDHEAGQRRPASFQFSERRR